MQRPAAASHNPTSIACCLLTVLIHACSSESTAPELYVPTDWTAIAAGQWHTCGLTTDGAAYCWGTMSPLYPLDEVPVAIPGGLSFIALASGNAHACAVTTSGAAYCWGLGGDGQFGNGSTTDSADSPIPVAV